MTGQHAVQGFTVALEAHQEAVTAVADYGWAFSIFDTSRIFTFVVALSLIIYGSIRAIKIDCESEENNERNNSTKEQSLGLTFHTIEGSQALFLPFGASLTLMAMFFFFDIFQLLFMTITAVLATISFSFLLLPVIQKVSSQCFHETTKISVVWFGRLTVSEIISFCVSSLVVMLWVLTGHWLLMDALAMGLCVAMIAFVRLPSLKASVVLLFGLLIYDVFWVFFSEYIFNVNVMVKVATQPANNPINYVANKLNMQDYIPAPAKLSLPGKLVFPSSRQSGQFSMLGLGDVVMPGLLLCFVLRYDNHLKATRPASSSSFTYFHCSLIGYFFGLVTATMASEITRAAQPALLYLVPFTVLPLVTRAYIKGDLKGMWENPFLPEQNETPKDLPV